MRKNIQLNNSIQDVIFQMSEGNPGAATVLLKMLEKTAGRPDGLLSLLDLDDMNIRGSQIWVAYKDYCGRDMDKLLAAVRGRDQEMIATVNSECFHPELGEQYTEKAVQAGGSFRRGPLA